jgi:uncharacterized NAD(P)/FAD-binding protein YdhS
MVDAVLSLQDMGWPGKIYAISRNGLLPLSHFKGVDYPDYITGEETDTSLRGLFRIFATRLREAWAKGINPAILVDKLRPHTHRLWQGFSLDDKRRFSRHFRTRWNITRHRIAPSIHQRLADAIATGKLEVLKARVARAEETSGGVAVTLEVGGPRGVGKGNGGSESRTINVSTILNCTGPKESCLDTDMTLLRNLSARGTVRSDAMNMGLDVAADFAVRDMTGKASEIIYATGPLLKGTLWESSAVPELRSQAFRLAEMLVRQIEVDLHPAPASRIAEAQEEFMEYWI